MIGQKRQRTASVYSAAVPVIKQVGASETGETPSVIKRRKQVVSPTMAA
jgi:hypothetical protein